MIKQEGSVLLMTLIVSALFSILLISLLTAYRLQNLLIHQHGYYFRAFQIAEMGLFLGYKKLPEVGYWHQESLGDINYHTELVTIDSCLRKHYRILSAASFQNVVVKLMAIYIQEPEVLSQHCNRLSEHWQWWQL